MGDTINKKPGSPTRPGMPVPTNLGAIPPGVRAADNARRIARGSKPTATPRPQLVNPANAATASRAQRPSENTPPRPTGATEKPRAARATGTAPMNAVAPRAARSTMNGNTPRPQFADGTMPGAQPPPLTEAQLELFARGQAAIEKKKYSVALRMFDEIAKENPRGALRSQPFNLFRSFAMACLMLEKGNREEAERNLRRVLAIDPYYEPARDALNQMKSVPKVFGMKLY